MQSTKLGVSKFTLLVVLAAVVLAVITYRVTHPRPQPDDPQIIKLNYLKEPEKIIDVDSSYFPIDSAKKDSPVVDIKVNNSDIGVVVDGKESYTNRWKGPKGWKCTLGSSSHAKAPIETVGKVKVSPNDPLYPKVPHGTFFLFFECTNGEISLVDTTAVFLIS